MSISQAPSKPTQPVGPSGFIELGGQLLVVDYGRIYLDGSSIGFLFEDGVLEQTSGSLGNKVKCIDQIPGCVFRGIDVRGQELILPGTTVGPLGSLMYNNVQLNVVHGRLSTIEHKLVGQFDDEGRIVLHDAVKNRTCQLDENTQLPISFKGKRSAGEDWKYEFSRPLYRKDKSYWENEIIRYFENYDQLSIVQKKYVMENLKLWAQSGLVQIVRKSEGTAALGNVKHGAAGVTGVKTGYVTFDKEEFEREILQSRRFGALSVVATRVKPYVEVRVNQVVAHEYGHQLEFILSQAAQGRVSELFTARAKLSNSLHPLPDGYEGLSEVIAPQAVEKRIFVSGYARTSVHEYFAESVSAFSVKESREVLKQVDPEMFALLEELVFFPENLVRPVLADSVLDLQASLRLGQELSESLPNE